MTTSHILNNFATNSNIKVVNSSWMYGITENPTVDWLNQTIAEEVYLQNKFWVSSAGNGTSNPSSLGTFTESQANYYAYPASLNKVFSVTAIGERNNTNLEIDRHKTNFVIPNSGGKKILYNHNDKVDLSAPGYSINSVNNCCSQEAVRAIGGTSSSAPIVSGVAALMYSLNSNFNPEEIECFLKSTSVDIYSVSDNYLFEGQLGAGRLDAASAVDLARKSVLPSNFTINPGRTFVWNKCMHPELTHPLEIYGTLIIESGASFFLNSGVQLNFYKGGKLIVEDNAYLCVADPNDIVIHGNNVSFELGSGITTGIHPKWDIDLITTTLKPQWDLSHIQNCNGPCELLAHVKNQEYDVKVNYPEVNAGADTSVCGSLSYYTLGGKCQPSGNYSWTPSTYLDDPNSPNPTLIKLNTTTTFTVTYVDPSDPNLTPIYDQVTITVHNKPTATITALGNNCSGYHFFFNGIESGEIDFVTWHIPGFGLSTNPSIISPNSLHQNLQTFVFQVPNNSIVPIEIEVKMKNGCTFNYTLQLEVNECCTPTNPFVTFGPNHNSWVGTNTPWGGAMTGGGTGAPGTILGVDGTVTLTNGVYHLEQSTIVFTGDYDPATLEITKSKMIVGENATLILDNCLLTADCDHMWYGIQVTGNGRVEMLNNSTLQHSFVGIEPIGQLASVRVEDSHFFNNLKSSIRFSEFESYSGGPIDILNNHFSCNTNQWKEPYTTSNGVYSNTYLFFDGANLDDVKIKENVFEESANQIISKNDAKLNIESNTFNNYRTQGIYAKGQGQSIVATSNTFNSYPTYLYFHNSPDFDQVNSFPLNVNSIYNYEPNVGIHLIGKNFIIDNNQFFGNWGAVNSQRHATGILARLVQNQTEVNSNYFHRMSYGVVLSEGQNMGAKVKGNKFENNRMAGVLIYDNGSVVTNSSIEISCNDFVRTQGFSAAVQSGITILANSYLNPQGTCQVGSTPAKPAGNEFLPNGYPLSYNPNGTANFPAGYWSGGSGGSGFKSIVNNGASFVYRQYINEYAHEPLIAPVGPVSLVTCSNTSQPGSPPLVGNASACTTPVGSGVANRSVSIGSTYEKDSENLTSEQESLHIIPNPAKDKVLLRFGDNNLINTEVELSDMIGKRTSIKLTTNDLGELDISKLQSGVYVIFVNSAEFNSIGKLIVQP